MLTPQQERSYAMWCHLSALSVWLGVPFGSLLGPFIVWQMAKDKSAFVDEHGKESLNFQLSIIVYTVAACIVMLLAFILLFTSGVLPQPAPTGVTITPAPSSPTKGAWLTYLIAGGFIGPILGLLIFPLIDLILSIVGAVRAGNGEHYSYPFIIRFIR